MEILEILQILEILLQTSCIALILLEGKGNHPRRRGFQPRLPLRSR